MVDQPSRSEICGRWSRHMSAFASLLIVAALDAPAPVPAALPAHQLISHYRESCTDIADYDALHSASIARGWRYVGPMDSPMAIAIANSVRSQPSSYPNSAVGQVLASPVVGGLLAALLTQGEHRRLYARTDDGRTLLLSLTYLPLRSGEMPAQVSCTVRMQGTVDAIPSDDEMRALMGRGPSERENPRRREGRPVRLIWHDNGGNRSVHFAPGPAAADAAPALGVLALSATRVSRTIPAPGDPEPDASAQPANPSPPNPPTGQEP
jgi:hypothetical protein